MVDAMPHPGWMTAGRDRWLLRWCAAITGAGCLALAMLHVAGGDDPAHRYRAALAAHGILLWDNYWFSGIQLPSYSLLYPQLAGAVGLLPLAVVSGMVASGLFALLLQTEYGARPARVPALAFSVLGCTTPLTGEFPFAFAVCAALGALVLLQRRRIWLALVCLAMTAACSPLAFAFLCLLLASVAIARHGLDRAGRLVLFGVLATGSLLVAVQLAFPDPGTLPFESRWLFWALALNGLGIVLTAWVPRARVLCVFLALWSLACLALFVLPTSVGRNIVRPELYALPLLLLAGSLAREAAPGGWRVRATRPAVLVVAVVAVGAATVYDLPYAAMVSSGQHNGRSFGASWRPAETFLARHASAQYRVEVVATPGHWEAYWLPRAGVPLVRGWFRQTDLVRNAAANGSRLQPAAYRKWLAVNAIRYVLLPPGAVEDAGEASLLLHGRTGLLPVWQFHGWRAYAVARPTGLLSGPQQARLISLGHATVSGWVTAPGRYLLHLRYNPYWTVHTGALCTAPTADGMTQLVVRRRGEFSLASQEDPLDVIGDNLDDDLAACPAR